MAAPSENEATKSVTGGAVSHTPGPLQIGKHDNIACELPIYDSSDDTPSVARVPYIDGLRNEREQLNNARLIAAAYTSYDKHCGVRAVQCAEEDLLGDLLEVLEEYIDTGRPRRNARHEAGALSRKAIAAIAKARGAQS